MSFNQSKSDKSDSVYRKSARSASFNQQRGFSGAYVKSGVGGGATPSPSVSSGSSLSSSRSFNKKSNNAQAGQSRVNPTPVNSNESNSAYTARTAQNGTHVQPQFHGVSDAPVANATAKSSESSAAQRSPRAVPKAPTSLPAPMSSNSAALTTPAKVSGDSSKTFSLQFGSISPSFMNGMTIPARTSSAPPNLDEQKRAQALHDSFRSVPSVPMPPVPKQQPLKKAAGVADQSNAGETHIGTKERKDSQVSASLQANQIQKPSVVPLTAMSMAAAYHQSQASAQFSGPNPQIHSQGLSTASLQMPLPMTLPIGNTAPVQQQVFVSGFQPHPLHPQGIMHQGQNMSFTPQMGPQLPHQLSNMGIGIRPQYSHQQGGKFSGPRKTTAVKITHPDTHEELRLDKRADACSDGGSSGVRSHPNMPSQSQPVQSFATSHPVNYYPPSSYNNTATLFYPPPSSLPLTSSQITPNSQPPRFNYAVNHGPQNLGFMNSSSHSSLAVNKAATPTPGIIELPNPVISHDMHNANSAAPSGVISVSSGGSGVVDSFANSTVFGAKKRESPGSSAASGDASSCVSTKEPENYAETSSQQSKLPNYSSVSSSLPKQSAVSVAESTEKPIATPLMPSSSAASEDSVSGVSNYEVRKKESLSRSNSLKDSQKKLQKKGLTEHQVAEQSLAVANVPSQPVGSGTSDSGVSETVGSKTENFAAVASEDLLAAPLDKSATSMSVPLVSTEGYVALSLGRLKNNKHDQVDELSQQDILLKQSTLGIGDKSETSSLEVCQPNINDGGMEFKQTKHGTANESIEVLPLKTVRQGQDDSTSCRTECDRISDNLGISTPTALDCRDVSVNSKNSVGIEAVSSNSGMSDLQQSSNPPESSSKHSKDTSENDDKGSLSLPALGTQDRPILEPNKVKATSKGKKKLKEILQKADAAGSTSDLYNAYKGPDEKKEAFVSSEKTESTSTSGSLKQLPADAAQLDTVSSENSGQSKAEPDDWEDAADMSTSELEVADKTQHGSDGSRNMTKKYSRDFLLKFAKQCTDLPEGFKIKADMAEALMSANISSSHVIERGSHPIPGRTIDRSGGMSRIDHRGSSVMDEDKWGKVSSAFHSGRDVRSDGIGGNAGFRPGQGGNFGVLRNPRIQTPLQYAGGILSGPVGNQGGMQRSSPDSERWQRAANFQQRGLFPSPSPQTPLQMMHKAEKKYEVGKVADVEEVKQRQLKAILNKLTPQNFEKLFEQVKAVNIDNAVTLTGVISQIFEKALIEPTFCEMYADFCLHLAAELPDFCENNEKITFKRLLLNKCQEEFERGEREQEEANKADEGEVKQSDEEREEKRTKARRRMLGNIRLIGELYKKKMLTERIMHESCIKKLLGQYEDPDEEDIEALCKLMSTIGEMIDHPKAKEHIDVYFERMRLLSNNMNLSSRVRFMLKDAIDLRKNKWQQKRKVEGPKKIEEVHRDAAQERQAQAGRLGRGPVNNPSARRGPMDFGPRGASTFSPNAQMGGLRGLPTQVRGYGSQDVRMDERQSYEARTLSVPLPQRPLGDDSITLGPQGGLGRGMSMRAPTAVSSLPVSDDSRRMTTGLNGYSNIPERSPYSSREDLATRYVPNRFAGQTAYDQSFSQERNMNYGNRDLTNADRNFDRPVAVSPPACVQGTTVSQSGSSDKVWPVERLRDMSKAAIREYYSARDEKEVAFCVKDLNSPSFHPSMVSLWVTDSFERKDTERDLLAQLLVNLVKSQDATLSQAQLIKGFESVLSTLEDAVNDAPKAAEFLGRIFARTITENVISLKEIGQLICDGGEEPGSLLEVGLAADVLGSTLEVIKLEKGDAVLSEIRKGANLRLETFRPREPIKSRKLEQFI